MFINKGVFGYYIIARTKEEQQKLDTIIDNLIKTEWVIYNNTWYERGCPTPKRKQFEKEKLFEVVSLTTKESYVIYSNGTISENFPDYHNCIVLNHWIGFRQEHDYILESLSLGKASNSGCEANKWTPPSGGSEGSAPKESTASSTSA